MKIETLVGIIVIAVAGLFLNFAYQKSDLAKPSESYTLTANFENCEGISQGSDIRIAGIKVGYVEKLELNPDSFLSTLYFRIDHKIKLPTDSRAAITSSGFLGGKFIALNPGGQNEQLKANDKIKYTQSTISPEQLISKFIYSIGSKD